MLHDLKPLIQKGLCAAVYTQLTDIEEEANGLLTYDRRVCKISSRTARQLRKEMGNLSLLYPSQFQGFFISGSDSLDH